MGIIVMLIITVAAFFVLKIFFSTAISIILAVAFLICWYILNRYSSSTGLIKANLKSYFISRKRGLSVEKALKNMVRARYPVSKKNQELIMSTHERVEGITRERNDRDRVRGLVYLIYCHENGDPPINDSYKINLDKVLGKIDKIYDSMCRRYDISNDKDENITNEKIPINPQKDADAYCNQGYLSILEGNLDIAIANFTEALHMDPICDKGFYNRGFALSLKGDLDSALSDAEKALELDSHNERYFNFVAEIKTKLEAEKNNKK